MSTFSLQLAMQQKTKATLTREEEIKKTTSERLNELLNYKEISQEEYLKVLNHPKLLSDEFQARLNAFYENFLLKNKTVHSSYLEQQKKIQEEAERKGEKAICYSIRYLNSPSLLQILHFNVSKDDTSYTILQGGIFEEVAPTDTVFAKAFPSLVNEAKAREEHYQSVKKSKIERAREMESSALKR